MTIATLTLMSVTMLYVLIVMTYKIVRFCANKRSPKPKDPNDFKIEGDFKTSIAFGCEVLFCAIIFFVINLLVRNIVLYALTLCVAVILMISYSILSFAQIRFTQDGVTVYRFFIKTESFDYGDFAYAMVLKNETMYNSITLYGKNGKKRCWVGANDSYTELVENMLKEKGIDIRYTRYNPQDK